jgi:hypothetical protein
MASGWVAAYIYIESPAIGRAALLGCRDGQPVDRGDDGPEHVSALIERLHVDSRLQLGLIGYHVVLLANPQLLSDVSGRVPDALAQGSVQDLATDAMPVAGAWDPTPVGVI